MGYCDDCAYAASKGEPVFSDCRNCSPDTSRKRGSHVLEGENKVELVFQNESGCGYSDPFVAVYINDIQHDKIWAYIDKEKGADGGWYSVVKFRRSNDHAAGER